VRNEDSCLEINHVCYSYFVAVLVQTDGGSIVLSEGVSSTASKMAVIVRVVPWMLTKKVMQSSMVNYWSTVRR